jgi:putative DNA primase/helicase
VSATDPEAHHAEIVARATLRSQSDDPKVAESGRRLLEGVMNARAAGLTYRLDSIGNGTRFNDQHAHEVRWVVDAGCWSSWCADENRWVFGDEPVHEMAKKTVASIYAAGHREWAKHTADTGFERMLKRASTEQRVCVRMADFDADATLLNTPSGAVDLRTGALIGCAPERLMTKRTRVGYEPETPRGAWADFLEYVLPDPELRDYVQSLAGYAVIAGVEERLLCFLVGPTGTGKTKLANTLGDALGDYAVTLAQDQLLVGAKDTYGLARLPGARLVLASEFDETQKINVALVKRLTGGDPVTVRMAYGKPFEYPPVGTLLVPTNRLPFFGADSATWSRICPVPFDHSLAYYGVKNLDERLAGAGEEALAWVVEGAVRFLASPLELGSRLWPPRAVLEALGEIRAEQVHLVEDFLATCVDRTDTAAMTSAGDLYKALGAWCAENGEKRVPTARTAGVWYRRSGLEPYHDGKARYWRGGRLLTELFVDYGPAWTWRGEEKETSF